jgi:hypothetical protein
MRVRERFTFLPSLDVCTCAVVGALALGNCAVCGLRVVVDHFDDHGSAMAIEPTVSAQRPPLASYVPAELRPVTGKGNIVGASPRGPAL